MSTPQKKTLQVPVPLNSLMDHMESGGSNDEELKEIQKPKIAPKFRKFCSGHERAEMRTQHLEHHVGNLILRNQAAEERELKRETGNLNKERELEVKIEEIKRLGHSNAVKLAGLPALAANVKKNATRINRNSRKLEKVENETKAIRARFN